MSTTTRGSTRMRARLNLALALAVLPALTLAAACSSSGGKSSPATTAGQSSAGQSSQGPSGPSSAGSAAAALVPAAYKNRTLNIATMDNYPPDIYFVDGKLTGFDPDLANAIAADLGMKLNLTSVSFDVIIPGIAAKRYDVGIPTFQVTPDRLKIMDFVTYMSAGTGFMTLADGKHKIASALDLCGTKAAVLIGSQQLTQTQDFSAQCTKAGKPAIAIQTFKSNNDVALAITSGRAEVDVSVSDTLAYAFSQSKGKFEVQPFTFAKAPAGIGLPKGSPMGPPILQAVKDLMANGTYKKIFDKYNASSVTISPDEAKLVTSG
jgi:polar amino acid transport system substrate-binding protein